MAVRPTESDLSLIGSISPIDLGWLAGIIEGEGSIIVFRLRDGKTQRCTVKVSMSDEDTVERLHRITGIGMFRKASPPKNPNHKQIWTWEVSQDREIRGLLVQILPLLSARRTTAAWVAMEQISLRMEMWKQSDELCENLHEREGNTVMIKRANGVLHRRCIICRRDAQKRCYQKRTSGDASSIPPAVPMKQIA